MKHYLWQSSTALTVVIASVVLAGLTTIYLTRRGTPVLSRVAARYSLLGMIGWLCLEYFMGRFSTLFWGDEGNVVPPVLNYYATYLERGQLFAHEFLGGVDRVTMSLVGPNYISLDMTLTRYLPMWAVVMANKVASFTLGSVGMYLLCRKVVRAPRFLSIIVAGIFIVIDGRHVDVTLVHGPAWGSLPAIAFLAAGPLGRSLRSFIASLIGLAALFALLPPTYICTGAGLIFVIAVVCFYDGPAWRPVAAAIAILLAVIANWHEVLWAYLQVSAEAYKSAQGGSSTLALMSFPVDYALPASVVAMVVLFGYRDRFLYPSGGAVLISLLLAPILKLIIGLSPALVLLANDDWVYIYEAVDVFGLLIVARALHQLQTSIDRAPRLKGYVSPCALLCGILVFGTLFYKGAHLFELIHRGGHAHFTSIENLKDREWEEPGLHRFVTLRGWGSEPNVAAGFYGLDIFDGRLNLAPRSTYEYWYHGIYKIADPKMGSTIVISADPNDWSWENLEYDLNAKVRTRFLRAVNVQYVLSFAPIKEEGLTLVSSPDEPRTVFAVHRNWSDKLQYYARRIKKIDAYGKIFVYRLRDAVPRAFGAGAIDIQPKEENVREAVLGGAEAALAGRARIAGSSREYFKAFRGGVTVGGIAKTKNGYVVHVDAPSDGAVVLNVPFTSFWRARVDNVEQKVVRANFVQMAVFVPQGAKTVEFDYARPLLRDVLVGKVLGVERR